MRRETQGSSLADRYLVVPIEFQQRSQASSCVEPKELCFPLKL